jgi:hypothetical protein
VRLQLVLDALEAAGGYDKIIENYQRFRFIKPPSSEVSFKELLVSAFLFACCSLNVVAHSSLLCSQSALFSKSHPRQMQVKPDAARMCLRTRFVLQKISSWARPSKLLKESQQTELFHLFTSYDANFDGQIDVDEASSNQLLLFAPTHTGVLCRPSLTAQATPARKRHSFEGAAGNVSLFAAATPALTDCVFSAGSLTSTSTRTVGFCSGFRNLPDPLPLLSCSQAPSACKSSKFSTEISGVCVCSCTPSSVLRSLPHPLFVRAGTPT